MKIVPFKSFLGKPLKLKTGDVFYEKEVMEAVKNFEAQFTPPGNLLPHSPAEWREFLSWVVNDADKIYVQHMIGWRDDVVAEMYSDFKRRRTIKSQALKARGVMLEILDDYSKFLEDHHYLDTDWRTEEPLAINEFMEERKNKANEN